MAPYICKVTIVNRSDDTCETQYLELEKIPIDADALKEVFAERFALGSSGAITKLLYADRDGEWITVPNNSMHAHVHTHDDVQSVPRYKCITGKPSKKLATLACLVVTVLVSWKVYRECTVETHVIWDP
jgi:hypothetical protein